MEDEYVLLTREIPPVFDLQLFAAEDEGRTEEATPRKKLKARERGQVAKSAEVAPPLILLGMFFAFTFLAKNMYVMMLDLMKMYLEDFSDRQFTMESLFALTNGIIVFLLKILLPVMLIAFVIAVASNLMQFGFVFTFKPIKFDFSKIKLSFSNMFKRTIASKQVAMNLFKSVVKIVIIGYFAYSVMMSEFSNLINMINMDLNESLRLICSISYKIVVRIGFLLLGLGIIDFFFQKREFKQSLKMRKEEVKEERKMMEGDPQVKGKIREKHRMIAARRMMKEIPKADVVITNPTHIAVAIQYDQTFMASPRVIAKGEGFIAMRIRQIAEENDVAIYTDPPLAQALFKSTEVGDEIPVELYQAVASVLAWVYRLKNKTGAL